jgi:hypothetical protein
MDSSHLAESAIGDRGRGTTSVVDWPSRISMRRSADCQEVYAGHVRHEGHFSRTVLDMFQSEGLVQRDQASETWRLGHTKAAKASGY